MVTFTIGGVLPVQGLNYAITAGHVFSSTNLQSSARFVVPDISLGESEGSKDGQDEYSESDSPFVVFDDDSSTGGSLTSTHSSMDESSIPDDYMSLAQAPSFINPPHCRVTDKRDLQEAESWIRIGVVRMDSAGQEGANMDWALIDLDEPDEWNANTWPVSGQGISSSLAVKSSRQDKPLQATAVWIHGGVSGGTRAWSNNCPAQLYHLHSDMMETRKAQQFITEAPLSPGDSGAWAVKGDGTLCGHVAARRAGAVTLAYVVPISSILNDIKAR